MVGTPRRVLGSLRAPAPLRPVRSRQLASRHSRLVRLSMCVCRTGQPLNDERRDDHKVRPSARHVALRKPGTSPLINPPSASRTDAMQMQFQARVTDHAVRPDARRQPVVRGATPSRVAPPPGLAGRRGRDVLLHRNRSGSRRWVVNCGGSMGMTREPRKNVHRAAHFFAMRSLMANWTRAGARGWSRKKRLPVDDGPPVTDKGVEGGQ
jgi:hypothetical protein